MEQDKVVDESQTKRKVTTLNLDHCKLQKIQTINWADYSELRSLSLINTGLQNLEFLDAVSLPNLTKIDLCDNKIKNGFEKLLKFPTLKHVMLSGNRIDSVDQIRCLSELPNLVSLECISCAISIQEDAYREAVFAALPQLQYLDMFDRKNEKEMPDTVMEEDEDEERLADGEEDGEDEEEGDEDDDEEDEDDEEEEEMGISALQRSSLLNATGEDDDEYIPGEEEDDDEDEDDDDDEGEEEDGTDEKENGKDGDEETEKGEENKKTDEQLEEKNGAEKSPSKKENGHSTQSLKRKLAEAENSGERERNGASDNIVVTANGNGDAADEPPAKR